MGRYRISETARGFWVLRLEHVQEHAACYERDKRFDTKEEAEEYIQRERGKYGKTDYR